MGAHRLSPATAAAAAAAALAATACLAGCGTAARPRAQTQIPAALAREARPIGRGPRFAPPAHGSVIGSCRRRLGPRIAAHVEVFAANRVVLVAAGIGTRGPRRWFEGRIAAAGCFGPLVTTEPTGVVLVAPGTRLTVADLFRAWGQPLGPHRLASFAAAPGQTVAAYVDGRRRGGPVGAIPLSRHAEIVLEVGPHVPPHASYRFPPED